MSNICSVVERSYSRTVFYMLTLLSKEEAMTACARLNFTTTFHDTSRALRAPILPVIKSQA